MLPARGRRRPVEPNGGPHGCPPGFGSPDCLVAFTRVFRIRSRAAGDVDGAKSVVGGRTRTGSSSVATVPLARAIHPRASYRPFPRKARRDSALRLLGWQCRHCCRRLKAMTDCPINRSTCRSCCQSWSNVTGLLRLRSRSTKGNARPRLRRDWVRRVPSASVFVPDTVPELPTRTCALARRL